jgi:hypothetical protein
MSDTNQERLKAIREAWKNERAYVRQGNGTRDWVQSEQRQIVAKGRADGYEGHHMKSVKDYPQHAGDPNNIQFLNRNEHINGAHRGNSQNATNGYYNPKTGTMHNFGNGNPQAPQPQKLSSPYYQATNKGIEAARQKAAQKNSGNNTAQSTNKGIKSFQNKASGQSANTASNSNSGQSSKTGQKSAYSSSWLYTWIYH